MSELDSTLSRTLVDTLNAELHKLREENERLKKDFFALRSAYVALEIKKYSDIDPELVEKHNANLTAAIDLEESEAKLQKAIEALEKCEELLRLPFQCLATEILRGIK